MTVLSPQTVTGGSRSTIFFPLMGVALMAIACSGCNAVILAGYLIGGPPTIKPEFMVQTNMSLKDDDKTVAVVCYAPKELKFDVDDVDAQLALHVAHRLNSHDIKVLNPQRVQKWLDNNDDWYSPSEVGEALEADWVVYIDMREYTLYEKGSTNLYRGRTTAMVQVVDMSDGEVVFDKELVSVYPLRAPKPTGEISRERFKALYLSRLSEEIGQLFYEKFAGEEIAHGFLD